MERLETDNTKENSKYKKIIMATCISLLVSLWSPEAKADISEVTLNLKNKNSKKIICNIYKANDWNEKFEKSIEFTPIKELEYFLKFFGIQKEGFSAKVREIQNEHNLKFDGIIGKQTSKTLFLKYYFPELENIGYKWISEKMRQNHEQAPEWKSIDNSYICKDDSELNTLLATVENTELEREEISEEDIMKLRYIIYQEMHRKHYEVNLFDKRVLWGYWDINYDAPVYPFINPEIKWVPDSLEDAKCLYGDLVKRITWDNGIIVWKDESWKHILVFYKDNKRFLTTYVSPGTKNRRTPVSNLHAVRRHDKYHRSSKYENAAMSYAVWLSGGYFFHNGVTTGYGKSHGCIRMPMMYAKILHEETKELKNMPFVFQPKIRFESIIETEKVSTTDDIYDFTPVN